jgi:hypothetical protein
VAGDGTADPELDALQRRGTRLGIGAIIGVGLLVVATVVVALGVLISTLGDDLPAKPRIERDKPQLQLTVDRLASVRDDLAAIPPPPGASGDHATESKDCTYDNSGNVGQPAVGRSWKVRPVDASGTIAAVAAALNARGWVDSPVSGAIVERRLTRSWGDWSARIEIGRSYEQDEVWVDGSVVDALPCRLASDSGD